MARDTRARVIARDRVMARDRDTKARDRDTKARVIARDSPIIKIPITTRATMPCTQTRLRLSFRNISNRN